MDAHPGTLRPDQQLRIEEPGLVDHLRQQPPGGVGADGLEATLGVANPGAQHDVQEEVIAARNQLALESASDTRTGRQAASDRDIAVP